MLSRRMDLWYRFEEVYHNEGETRPGLSTRPTNQPWMKALWFNWPAMQPLVWLMLERAGDHDSFATEYQNKPVSEGSPFNRLTFWTCKRRDLIFFGAVDPSLGKKGHGRDPIRNPDRGFDRLAGTMDVVEASIRRRLPDVIISVIIALQREYRCLLWFVEPSSSRSSCARR